MPLKHTIRPAAVPSKLLSAMLVIALLSSGGTPIAQTSRFSVDFSWSGTAACFDPQSPAFSLTGVPTGTKQLKFTMRDLDAPNFQHGGGTVPYRDQNQIARGAFSYRGPCPPQGRHRYQWTVEAQDDAGRTLATTTVTKEFPPH
jgi:phosphatidylethanolamine-binding protein (PEBP) family uncharacterized protein